MGFTTGFTGGVTLTLGVAYLTVLAHQRHRSAQAAQLRSQARVLDSLLDTTPVAAPLSRAELAREERGTLVETAKDRWNEEVENAVRWVQRTDWEEVRAGMEGAVARLMGTAPAERVKENTLNIAESAKAKTEETLSSAKQKINQVEKKAVASTKEKLGQAEEQAGGFRDAAKVKADRAVAESKTGAHHVADSVKNSGGTVDAARSAVRDVVSKGIEKGKEAIGKAATAVGLAEEKVVQSVGGSSDVEKALRQRYETSNALDKTPEQVLAERYKPTKAQDNSVLRGV